MPESFPAQKEEDKHHPHSDYGAWFQANSRKLFNGAVPGSNNKMQNQTILIPWKVFSLDFES